MARFCELGITTDIIIGKGIEITELFDKRILIEKTSIRPTKYPGKGGSPFCMQMQVCLAKFGENNEYEKDELGNAIGEIRSCFTGSTVLISAIEHAEKTMNHDQLYPIDTTIVKSGKCFKFT